MGALGWLLLTLPLAVLLSWLHPRVWVPLDVKRFTANGSKDTLLRTFHRQRGTWRALFGLLIALLGAGPLLLAGAALPFLLLASAVAVWELAYWLYDFNPRLNVARNLPYVGKYHVSWNPNASELDRYVWRKAWLQVREKGEVAPPAQEDARVVAVAGPLLQQLLTKWLYIGGAVAIGLATLALLLYGL